MQHAHFQSSSLHSIINALTRVLHGYVLGTIVLAVLNSGMSMHTVKPLFTILSIPTSLPVRVCNTAHSYNKQQTAGGWPRDEAIICITVWRLREVPKRNSCASIISGFSQLLSCLANCRNKFLATCVSVESEFGQLPSSSVMTTK